MEQIIESNDVLKNNVLVAPTFIEERKMRIEIRNRILGVRFLFFVGLFILVYNPPILMFNTMHIVGAISLLYLLVSNGFNNSLVLKKETAKLLSGFVILFLYLFLCVHVLNGQGLDTIMFPIYFLIDIIPFGMAMKKYMEIYRLQIEWAITLVIQVALLQALFALMALLIPAVQHFFVVKMISYGYSEVYSTLSAYRMYGFSNALTNATPVVQSIIAIMSVWFAINKNKKYYFAALLIMISAVINARISIVIFGIGIIVLLISRTLSFWGRVKIIFVALLACVFVVGILLPAIQSMSPLTYEWVTEGFNELASFKFGNTSYASNSYFGYLVNADRFILPDDIVSLCVGKGYSIMSIKNPSGYQSDVGYICDIWTGGIFYIVILYTFFFLLLTKLRKHSNAFISFVGSFYLFALIFINIKGVALSMNAFINLLIIIECIAMVKNEKRGGL